MKKEKKKFKKWEKVFVSLSTLMVVIVFIVYASRLVYYYKVEHPDKFDNRLSTHIKKEGVVYSSSGLYTFDEDLYYFYGKDVNNYVWYSGNLWRIIEITSSGIKMISNNSLTSLVWGINSEYDNSYINKWLKDKMNYLDKNTLQMVDYCTDKIDLNNITCNNKYSDYVGLLSVTDYLRAGGKDGYLNNGEYFWLSNSSLENNAYYVFSDGGINNLVSSNEMYYSYGVRPVITLNDTFDYYGGDGTKDNPYIINIVSDNNIGSKNIGEYVSYSDYKWRIYDKSSGYVKLILDGYVNDKKYTYSKVDSYLNKDFYNKLSKDKLVKCSFNKGSYGKSSNYNYENINSKTVNNYVGLPSIGEFFINDYADYWLYNTYEGNKELNYKINSFNRLIADTTSNGNYVRAVVCIMDSVSITSGEGFINSPYIVE